MSDFFTEFQDYIGRVVATSGQMERVKTHPRLEYRSHSPFGGPMPGCKPKRPGEADRNLTPLFSALLFIPADI